MVFRKKKKAFLEIGSKGAYIVLKLGALGEDWAPPCPHSFLRTLLLYIY